MISVKQDCVVKSVLMPNTSLEGLSVLVVEDVDAIRSLVVKIVEGLGAAHVAQAFGVQTAFEALETAQFDVMLLDYELNGRDGLEIVKTLRQTVSHINHDMPIVLLTGHSEKHIVQDAVMAGADDYLVKPVMPDVLGKRVKKVIAARDAAGDGGVPKSEVVWSRASAGLNRS